MSVPTAISEMSVFCNLGRTPWVYRAFSYQSLFADAEKGPMQIALGQSDICEFESYMPSHAVRSRAGDILSRLGAAVWSSPFHSGQSGVRAEVMFPGMLRCRILVPSH